VLRVRLGEDARITGLPYGEATGATRVLVTHGSSSPLVRWLNETSRQAGALPTCSADEAQTL
jgi:hypothetical protein